MCALQRWHTYSNQAKSTLERRLSQQKSPRTLKALYRCLIHPFTQALSSVRKSFLSTNHTHLYSGWLHGRATWGGFGMHTGGARDQTSHQPSDQ